MQIEALGPVAAAVNTFTEDYKSFATAIDATRHSLPVKNVDIGEDADQFLGEICLTWRKTTLCCSRYGFIILCTIYLKMFCQFNLFLIL